MNGCTAARGNHRLMHPADAESCGDRDPSYRLRELPNDNLDFYTILRAEAGCAIGGEVGASFAACLASRVGEFMGHASGPSFSSSCPSKSHPFHSIPFHPIPFTKVCGYTIILEQSKKEYITCFESLIRFVFFCRSTQTKTINLHEKIICGRSNEKKGC